MIVGRKGKAGTGVVGERGRKRNERTQKRKETTKSTPPTKKNALSKKNTNPLTLRRLPVELDERLLPGRVEQHEGVHAKALHVAVVEGDAEVVEQEGEHVLFFVLFFEL